MSLDRRVPVGVGVFVLTPPPNSKILLGVRKNSHGAGTWSLPGGKPDGGEHPLTAARRELFEETGIEARDLWSLNVWTYERFEEEGFHYVTLYFAAEAGDQQPQLREPEKCEGWHWFDYRCLPEPLFAGIREAVDRLGEINS